MKCKHCKAEWNAPNATSVVMEKCPFCGQSLIEKDKKLDTLEAVLVEIVDSYGVDVLRNGKSMLAYVSDLAPSMRKEKKLLSYLIECGGHTQILNSLKNDPKEQKMCVENVIYTMHDQLFLEKAAAQTVCYAFYAAVSGQTLEAVTPKSKPAPTPVTPAVSPKPAVATPTLTAVAPKPAVVAQAPSLTPEEQYQKGKQFYQNKNYKNAFEWYKKAAEQGHVEAQNSLGWSYQYSYFGVDKDLVQAAYWYRKAAEQEHAIAQYNLGFCYKYGLGVDKDLVQAAYWYHKSAENGYADAKIALNKLEGSKIDQENEKLFDFKLITNDGYAVQLKNSKSSPTKVTIPSHYRGKPVIQISERGFEGCYNLISIEIPASIKTIGFSALKNCFNLREIVFKGTKQEWSAINKGNEWKSGNSIFVVRCTDGDISKLLA